MPSTQTQFVSVGQASATALVTWLSQQLPGDCNIFDRWPEPTIPLFAPKQAGTPQARLVFTVFRTGRRTRLDMLARFNPPSLVQVGTNLFQVTFTLGSFIQPLQLDVWGTTDIDRDDGIARLDSILNAGAAATGPAATDLDPFRDGLLLPLQQPFSGFVDCWFDEPEIFDDPGSTQVAEYQASYYGEARGEFKQTVTVPAMSSLILAQQLSTLATPLPGQLWNLATIAPNPSPPPAGKVTYSTSSTP